MVALILQVRHVAPDRAVGDNVFVQLVDGGDDFVHLGDDVGNGDVGLLPKLLDRLAHILKRKGDVLGLAYDFGLLQRSVGRYGEKFQRRGEILEQVRQGRIFPRLAEKILRAGEEIILDGELVQLGQFGTDILQQPFIDPADDIGNLDPRGDAVKDPGFGIHDLARIPFRVDVGDVVGNDVQRLLVDQQPAPGGTKGLGKARTHVKSSRSGPKGCDRRKGRRFSVPPGGHGCRCRPSANRFRRWGRSP